MLSSIHADAMRILREENTPKASEIFRLLRLHEGFQALVIYRFGRWLNSVRRRYGWVPVMLLYPAYWMLSAYIRKAYGIHLDQSADIAPGFYINHIGGIEVRNCRIGPRCTIYQHVKLRPAEGTDKGPVIGEGVFIGAHAQICADISIGDGASIGPGTVITQDIPKQCLVLGNPSRIVQRDYNNRDFFVKHLPCPDSTA